MAREDKVVVEPFTFSKWRTIQFWHLGSWTTGCSKTLVRVLVRDLYSKKALDLFGNRCDVLSGRHGTHRVGFRVEAQVVRVEPKSQVEAQVDCIGVQN